jgi:hypothetical protein
VIRPAGKRIAQLLDPVLNGEEGDPSHIPYLVYPHNLLIHGWPFDLGHTDPAVAASRSTDHDSTSYRRWARSFPVDQIEVEIEEGEERGGYYFPSPFASTLLMVDQISTYWKYRRLVR